MEVPLDATPRVAPGNNAAVPMEAAGNVSSGYQTLMQQKKEIAKVKQLLKKGSGALEPEGGNHKPLGWVPSAYERNCRALRTIVLCDPLSFLLIAWPLGILASVHEWGNAWTFWINFLAMIPLAKILGDATEEVATGLKSDVLGGLLNATFGNAVEMILTVQTLRVGGVDVVKGCLLGSILSNLLLVLGMCFFAGGLTPYEGRVRGKVQVFSSTAALTNMTMLFLATLAFSLPTVFFSSAALENYDKVERHRLELHASRICSTYIITTYLAFLVFQLYTHVDVFSSHDDEEGEDAQLSISVATLLLLVATVLVCVSSEFLVGSIDGLSEEWALGREFIGFVLLPIVGNACEHASAIRMAVCERMDITINIAVGSSTQVAMLVVPSSVIIGWCMDVPMDLNFGMINAAVLAFAVIIAYSIMNDGSSNWLEGYMLIVAYLTIATLYWFVPSERHL
eukprot:TRINITY_DN47429_c0_g1_i1.p1 TRINITY_DN47429_c0_g1~~TRINITY_DN47429_c0_g1_i1.p1  ORF type:complete len:453 (+),score=82.78 TRINITY_DN47429_c0_g1_i1:172-1530(+)